MWFRRPFAWYQNCAVNTKELLIIEWYSVLQNLNSLKHRNYALYYWKIPWVSYELPLNDYSYFENVTTFTCIVLIHHAKATKMCRHIMSSTKNMIRGSLKVYQSYRCSAKWIEHLINEGIKQTSHITVHQWMVLRLWPAFYVSMGSIGCIKTDVNLSDR